MWGLALVTIPLVVILALMLRELRSIRMQNEALRQERQAMQQALEQNRPELIGREIGRSIAPLLEETRSQIGGLGAVIAALASDMRGALDQLPVAAQGIGDSSASLGQIADQFGTMAHDLRLSQEQIQQALRNLADPGAVPAWLDQLHDTVDPLRHAGTQIGQHYQHQRDLLTTTGAMLQRWNEQGRQMAAGTRSLAELFGQWSSDEAVARQQQSEQIALRLDAAQHATEDLSSKLHILTHSVERMTRLTESMKHSNELSHTALDKLLAHQTSNQEQHQRAVETLGALSQTMIQREETLGTQLQSLVEHSHSLSEGSRKSQQEAQQQQIQVLQAIGQKIQHVTEELGSQYDKKIVKLVIQLEAVQRRDGEIRERLEDVLDRMPSKQMYQFQIGLLFALLLAALVLIFR